MYKKAAVSALMLAATLTLVACDYPEDKATHAANASALAETAPSAAGVHASDPPVIQASASSVFASDPPIRNEASIEPSAAGVYASDPPPIRKVASL